MKRKLEDTNHIGQNFKFDGHQKLCQAHFVKSFECNGERQIKLVKGEPQTLTTQIETA